MNHFPVMFFLLLKHYQDLKSTNKPLIFISNAVLCNSDTSI